MRAFPPRLVHVLAGNSPGVTGGNRARGAVEGRAPVQAALDDLFTGTAILRTMAEIDPDHPMTQSLSASTGGAATPRSSARCSAPQYFDKLVAWGGGAAIQRY